MDDAEAMIEIQLGLAATAMQFNSRFSPQKSNQLAGGEPSQRTLCSTRCLWRFW